MRTVILRGADRAAATVEVHSDTRTAKVRALKAHRLPHRQQSCLQQTHRSGPLRCENAGGILHHVSGEIVLSQMG
jgi:guanyl-specific ribonuclease Sa